MKAHFVDQGTSEWYALRMGLPTASQFHKIVTPVKCEASTQAKGYMYRLIAERLLKESMDQEIRVEWVERGKVEQAPAAAQFQLVTDLKLKPVGFVTTDDGLFGASPDYLIEKRLECVEVKCPAPWTQIEYLLAGPGVEYRPQVQGQLFVTGLDCNHFYAYHPRMPAKHIVSLPEPAYIGKMRDHLMFFVEELFVQTERARKLGAYVEAVRASTPLDATVPAAERLHIVVPDGGTILDGG